MSFYSVAIDGPSGAGKSSIAKAAAERLGFLYVDTGAIYRTVGLAAYRAGYESTDRESVLKLLPELDIRLAHGEDGLQHMLLAGEDVTGEIRQPVISRYASDVSALPEVRAFLMDTQRSLAAAENVIMDGRDIGTVVLPDAGLKIFLTASPEERALRRFRELAAKGESVTYEQCLRDMQQRDKNDTERSAAPLRRAEDAVLLDTTELDFDQSRDTVIQMIRDRFSL